MLAWLGRLPDRRPNTVAVELTVVREFWKYLRRLDPRRFKSEPRWPRLKTGSRFVATILSPEQVRLMLHLIGRLDRPRFRRHLYRALFLVQYCAGLRFGEALRLRIRDVDLRRGTFFIAEFKGRSRWVPFHPSLTTELKQYLRARKSFVGTDPRPDDRLFVGANLHRLPVETAGGTFRKLYRMSGMKPARGRVGPRPYDLRHTFVVHRLTRWYRQGANLHDCRIRAVLSAHIARCCIVPRLERSVKIASSRLRAYSPSRTGQYADLSAHSLCAQQNK